MLTPVTDVAGEYVRQNLVEQQAGVDIVLDYQVIDVDTCEPVADVYLEMWHCNATGVYSGVIASGNGDSSDETNIDKTWLRGIQKTDSDGVAQFESIFPGHYTGRATHIHVMVHANATLLANKTLGHDNYASHVGQAFFDQDLIEAIDQLAPYSSNTQQMTDNSDDSILGEEVSTDGVDPFMEYAMLGDSISDGLFAWLAFGINKTESTSVSPAVYLYEDGGVANENSGMGGGDGGGGPGGEGGQGGPGGSRPSGGPPGSGGNTTVTSAGGAATQTSSSGSSATTTSAGKAFERTDMVKLICQAFAATVFVLGCLAVL